VAAVAATKNSKPSTPASTKTAPAPKVAVATKPAPSAAPAVQKAKDAASLATLATQQANCPSGNCGSTVVAADAPPQASMVERIGNFFKRVDKPKPEVKSTSPSSTTTAAKKGVSKKGVSKKDVSVGALSSISVKGDKSFAISKDPVFQQNVVISVMQELGQNQTYVTQDQISTIVASVVANGPAYVSGLQFAAPLYAICKPVQSTFKSLPLKTRQYIAAEIMRALVVNACAPNPVPPMLAASTGSLIMDFLSLAMKDGGLMAASKWTTWITSQSDRAALRAKLSAQINQQAQQLTTTTTTTTTVAAAASPTVASKGQHSIASTKASSPQQQRQQNPHQRTVKKPQPQALRPRSAATNVVTLPAPRVQS
jgi:hypothetical protein